MTVLKSKVVKTRKVQTCWGCKEEFEKGSKLRFQTDVCEGVIDNSYWCKVCDKTLEHSNGEFDDYGISFGEVKEYHSWDDNLKLLERTY